MPLNAYSRFSILGNMKWYPFQTQRNTVIDCTAIHNYLWRTVVNDYYFIEFADVDEIKDNLEQDHQDGQEQPKGGGSQAGQYFMLSLHEHIANQLSNLRV